MSLGAVLLLLFLGLLVARVPVAAALGAAALWVLWAGRLGLGVVSYNFQAGIAKFPLLAIPLFILAGVVMDRAGIAERIVRLAVALVGRVRAGAAVASVAVTMFWGAVSGSGPATVAALAPILVPMMTRRGYDKPFASVLVAAAAELSIIIPPSIAFIVYATIVSGSIAEQFLAGFLPGLVMGLVLMAGAAWMVSRRGWDQEPDPDAQRVPVGRLLREAFWGLLTPLVILGGIYGGVFTPTEAAVVAVAWGLFVGFFVYRTLRVRDLLGMLYEASVSSAVVMAIVAWAGIFAWTADTVGLVRDLSRAAMALAGRPYLFLALLNLVLLFLGTLMDAVSIYFVMVPMLIPVLHYLGWDPVWFGVMMTVNLAIGQITPPVAVNLFVAARVNQVPIEQLWRQAWLFAALGVAGLVIITYVPWISQVLPRLLYGR